MQITLLNSRHNSENFDISFAFLRIFLRSFVVPKTVQFFNHPVHVQSEHLPGVTLRTSAAGGGGHGQRCKRPRCFDQDTNFRLAHQHSDCFCFMKRPLQRWSVEMTCGSDHDPASLTTWPWCHTVPSLIWCSHVWWDQPRPRRLLLSGQVPVPTATASFNVRDYARNR